MLHGVTAESRSDLASSDSPLGDSALPLNESTLVDFTRSFPAERTGPTYLMGRQRSPPRVSRRSSRSPIRSYPPSSPRSPSHTVTTTTYFNYDTWKLPPGHHSGNEGRSSESPVKPIHHSAFDWHRPLHGDHEGTHRDSSALPASGWHVGGEHRRDPSSGEGTESRGLGDEPTDDGYHKRRQTGNRWRRKYSPDRQHLGGETDTDEESHNGEETRFLGSELVLFASSPQAVPLLRALMVRCMFTQSGSILGG